MKFLKDNMMIIESIIYIMLLVLVIYLNINGAIIFKFLPSLFVLGIVGNYIFDKPIITSCFSFVTSLTFVEFLTANSLTDNIIYSIYVMALVGFGEAVGYFIKHLKKNTNKNNKLKNGKTVVDILIISLVSIMLNDYIQGSVYNYLDSKKILNEYLETSYSFSDIKIYDGKYINYEDDDGLISKYFRFKVEIENDVFYYFVDSQSDKVIDEYLNAFASKKVSDLNNVLNEMIENKEIEIDENYSVSFTNNNKDLNYNLKVTYNSTNGDVNNEMESLDKDLETFLNYSNSILEKLLNLNEFSEIQNLELKYIENEKVNIATISKEYFFDIEKYNMAFENEFLDG